ncbi:hypothetical protein D3C87_191360 [compost metagenome]
MKASDLKDSRLYGFIILYDMQTDFFLSALEGISDTDAHNRHDTKANHVAWLAGSLLQQRYEQAGILTGQDLKQTGDALFKDNQGIKDNVTYPSLEQYKNEWKKVSTILREAFINATTEKLDSMIDIPGMKITVFELISFSIYREANCIGQIALWRRLLGYDAMKYM